MKVALFIPCYVDQLYPHVGMATVAVLDHLGIEHEFPEGQTCCGQPMANTGCASDTEPLARRFVEVFDGYDHIVAPSGSCAAMVRHHYDHYFSDSDDRARRVRERTLELSEFLTSVVGVREWPGRFEHAVGLHQSCHGLRELRLGASSEMRTPRANTISQVLQLIDGIRFTTLERTDECCGFGGTFAVAEESVSCMMGDDRIRDHRQAGTEIMTAGDMSCLMHLDGIIRRQQVPIKVMHFAEILASVL